MRGAGANGGRDGSGAPDRSRSASTSTAVGTDLPGADGTPPGRSGQRTWPDRQRTSRSWLDRDLVGQHEQRRQGVLADDTVGVAVRAGARDRQVVAPRLQLGRRRPTGRRRRPGPRRRAAAPAPWRRRDRRASRITTPRTVPGSTWMSVTASSRAYALALPKRAGSASSAASARSIAAGNRPLGSAPNDRRGLIPRPRRRGGPARAARTSTARTARPRRCRRRRRRAPACRRSSSRSAPRRCPRRRACGR